MSTQTIVTSITFGTTAVIIATLLIIADAIIVLITAAHHRRQHPSPLSASVHNHSLHVNTTSSGWPA